MPINRINCIYHLNSPKFASIKYKNMRSFSFLISLFAILWTAQAFGQPAGRSSSGSSLSSGTIDSQFVHLVAISRSQDGFEIVRRANLELIRRNVADSLNAYRRQIGEISASIGQEKAVMTALSDSLSLVKGELQATLESRDSFSFLGISMSKTTYSLLVWGIVLVLAIALIFYIYRFNQGHVVTRDAQKAFDDLQTEFDQHRKKAMEKEQKLKRQLQDEINRKSGG